MVKDLMTTDVYTLTPKDTITAAADLMKIMSIRHIPIVEKDRLVGLLTHRDYVNNCLAKLTDQDRKKSRDIFSKVPISKIMTRQVRTVTATSKVSQAAKLFLEHKIGCLPVITGDKVAGILTESDFIKAFNAA